MILLSRFSIHYSIRPSVCKGFGANKSFGIKGGECIKLINN